MNILYELETTQKHCYKNLRKDEFGKLIPIISDTCFSTMIANKERIKYASYIIALVLNEDYNEVLNNLTLEKSSLNKSSVIEAEKRLDCVCKYKDKMIDIEMNATPDKSRLNRNEEYIRTLFSQRKIGDDYSYHEVIQININNFKFAGMDDTIHRYETKETITGKDIIMSKNIKIFHIYLPRIKELYYNKEKLSKLELLMVVMNEKDDSEYLTSLIKGDKIMEDYRKDCLKASDENWLAYQTELVNERYRKAREQELRESGKSEGYESGRAEGIKENTIEMVKKMLEKNMSISSVSEISGLTIEEIKDIKNNIKD